MGTQTEKNLRGWASIYPKEFIYAYENNLLEKISEMYNWSIDTAQEIYSELKGPDLIST
ncbi:hypothetical protein [Flavobacterium sp.]|uniref:hypothetical protein n=1 Tax=Flavobacterium sp. TaxID=239 RepID=UPI00403324FA